MIRSHRVMFCRAPWVRRSWVTGSILFHGSRSQFFFDFHSGAASDSDAGTPSVRPPRGGEKPNLTLDDTGARRPGATDAWRWPGWLVAERRKMSVTDSCQSAESVRDTWRVVLTLGVCCR